MKILAVSELRLVKRSTEFRPKTDIKKVPAGSRGIYVLLKYIRRNQHYDVVYVGMAAGSRGGIKSRLRSHARSNVKADLWTHFSAFAVWENIREEEIRELEGLFRHIYRKDGKANRLNKQRGFKKLTRIRRKNPLIRKK